MKRTPLKRYKTEIRRLEDHEDPPATTPRRYLRPDGYVILRWKVGPYRYVEAYEHRLNAGQPDADMHVHHVNGEKSDNNPANLKVLSPSEHAKLHSFIDDHDSGRLVAGDLTTPAWRAEREIRRGALDQQMAELYESGLSTSEVAEVIGRTPSNVSRRLRAAGVKMRPRRRIGGSFNRVEVADMYRAGVGAAVIARHFGVSTARIRAAIDSEKVPRRGPGRVSGAKPARRVTGEAAARAAVYERSGGICEKCGGANGQEWHHRKNRSQGGEWSAGNGLHLCKPCHRHVTEHPADGYEHGWLVRSTDDPYATACLIRRGSRWCYLTDGGYADDPQVVAA